MSTLKQQRKNRLALADMLENRISDENFNVRKYVHECGTIGCAAGIAVLSGEFAYKPSLRHGSKTGWQPSLNGILSDWITAGQEMFGVEASDSVFWNLEPRSRQTVAAELRAIK